MRSLCCCWPNGFVPSTLNATSLLLRPFKRTCLFKLSFRSRQREASHCHRQINANFHVTSPATANLNNDCMSLQPFNDEEDFGTSTLTDVRENESYLPLVTPPPRLPIIPTAVSLCVLLRLVIFLLFQIHSTIRGQKFVMMALTCRCFLLKNRFRLISFRP